jgi:glycosyltransferase involved in cell wall biosynthesis
LKEALARLLNDEGLRSEMGRRARQRALKEFSLTVMIERILKLYKELISLD